MACMKWSAELSVNVPLLDEQHRRLFAMINDLDEAMAKRQGRSVLGALLTRLIGYTASHFKAEEEYMAKAGYAGLSRHKQEHHELIVRTQQLKKDFEAGKVTITLDVMKFLDSWLVNHILGSDRKYAPSNAVAGSHPAG